MVIVKLVNDTRVSRIAVARLKDTGVHILKDTSVERSAITRRRSAWKRRSVRVGYRNASDEYTYQKAETWDLLEFPSRKRARS